jgi:hypothetical protein
MLDHQKSKSKNVQTLSAWWSHEPLCAWFADSRRTRRPIWTDWAGRTLSADTRWTGIAGQAAITLDAGWTERARQAG